MLEFIVLGLVPGTRLQVTFTWVLSAVIVAASILVIIERKKLIKLIIRALKVRQTQQPAH